MAQNIQHIRTTVFGLSQRQFAQLVGASQPTVHRWETGELSPNIEHLARIREAAKKQRIPWKDAWFFDRRIDARVA